MQKSQILIIFCFIICCSASSKVHSQASEKIHTIEYFFDVDPGYGNAIKVSVNPANTQLNNFNFSAPIGTLSKGLHQLYVRSLDSSKRWSITASKLFYKESTVSNTVPKVNGGEYFFNTDPGFGNGTPRILGASLDLDFTLAPNISALSKGLNLLYVRVRDANGSWSHSIPNLIYKEKIVSNPISNVSKAEYFFDTDPGFGNGKPASVTAGQDISFSISGSIVTLSKGLHTLYVRVKDATGKWSLTNTQIFYKESVVSNPIPNITKAEYFFDTDPGFGNGINAVVTAGQDIAFSLSGNIATLNKGLHTLYVRVKDANGKWSLTHNQLFYKENIVDNPVPNITKAEYFIDVDPGFGNGSPFVISPEAQDITEAIDLPATGLAKGFHRLYIRVLDANNKWSITNTPLFYYEPIISTPALTDLITMEYFWGTDPGFGNANKITLPADNNGQVTDFVMTIPTPGVFSYTYQNFYLRTIDANWSLTTVKRVDFSSIVLPVTLLEFTAIAQEKKVITNWNTAQEINLKHFIVEHSNDGISFNAIGTVNATGTSATNNSYEFVHDNPALGSNYYRLKQVDYDGTYTSSPTVRINFNSGNKSPIAYPNPVKNILTLSIPFELFNLENYQVVIRDAKSSLVKKQNLTQATSQIKLENLASGTYWLTLIDQKGNRIWGQTIIKE